MERRMSRNAEDGDRGAGKSETGEKKLKVSKEAAEYLQGLQNEADQIFNWLFGEGKRLIAPVIDAQTKGDKNSFRLSRNALWQNFRDRFIHNPNKNLKSSAARLSEPELRTIHAALAENFSPHNLGSRYSAPSASADEIGTIINLRQELQDNLEQFWLAEIPSPEIAGGTFPKPENNIFRLSIWIEKAGKAKNAILKTINEVSTTP